MALTYLFIDPSTDVQGGNQPPNTPTVTASSPTTTGVTLTSSAFDDDVGDTHQASQWQITTAGDTGFSSAVYDSGTDQTNLTSIVISGALSQSTSYISRVRHRDAGLEWSSYSATDAFSTAGVGGAVTADFFSNFIGSTYTDNGKWSELAGSNFGYLQIFTTSLDADVPGGRGMRTRGNVGDNFYNAITPTTPPPIPAVGEWTSWRWFWKPWNCDGDGNYHPVSFGQGSFYALAPENAFWAWTAQENAAGTWSTYVFSDGSPEGTFPYAPSGAASILTQQTDWYRFELNFGRVGTNSWDMRFRIYNEAGTLLIDETGLFGNFGYGGNTMDSDAPWTEGPASAAVQLEIGSPGVGSVDEATPYEAERWAAVAGITDSVPHVDMPYGYFDSDT